MTTLFGAASASTATARELADGMAKILGAPVPIVDKPGAGGAVGYTYLSQQKPDGYSIVWSSNSISTTFHTGQLPFDYKNLEHVARVTIENPALAVKADSPWKTLKELVDYAKANPEKVRVGNSGTGSQTHIAAWRCSRGRRQDHRSSPSALARPRPICWVTASKRPSSFRRRSSRR